jgi:hypothetical protein
MRFFCAVTLITLVSLVAVSVSPQLADGSTKSPKAVVEEFWKMETDGQRLTTEGWRGADSFFVRPVIPPVKRHIIVIDKDYSVWDPVVKDDTAEVMIGISPPLWNIDSQMRISHFPARDETKSGVAIKLIRSSKYWHFGPDGRTLKEESGEPEWRIAEPAMSIWLTVDAAIRYATQMRDSSKDPVTKKNATQTLRVLKLQ